jgi:hypothetical protein
VPACEDELSQGERHSKKDPLAELARLLEQDEAFRAVSRARADAPVNWSLPEHEELQPLRADLMPAQSASGGREATAPHVQAGAPDAAMPAHVAANYYEYGARYDEGHDGKHEKRGRLRVVAAVIVLIALVATAGTFGYFAWWNEPHVSDSGSMVAADPSANKGLDEGTKAVRRRSEGDLTAREPALDANGAPAELKAAPPRQTLTAPRGLTYGLDPTASPAPTLRNSDPPTSADAREGKSEQPAAGPSDASPAERRTTTRSAIRRR